MKYNSLHEYLEARFKDEPLVTDAMIKQAKKDYWRMYNTALKRRMRKEYPILRLRFTKEQMQLLKQKLHKKEFISAQVRRIVLQYLEEGGHGSFNNALVEQQLFLVSDYLEELLEEGSCISLHKIERLQEYIVAIQDALDKS